MNEKESHCIISLVRWLFKINAPCYNPYIEFLCTSEEKYFKKTIHQIKSDREMEERYTIFEEMFRDERYEGKAESKAEFVLELLFELGKIPDDIRNNIMNERNISPLTKWHKIAAKSNSLEGFLEKI